MSIPVAVSGAMPRRLPLSVLLTYGANVEYATKHDDKFTLASERGQPADTNVVIDLVVVVSVGGPSISVEETISDGEIEGRVQGAA